MKTNMRTYYMYLFLFLMAATIFIPLYVSVMGGFKTVGELRTNALGLPSNWNFDNYLSVLLNSKFWLYLGIILACSGIGTGFGIFLIIVYFWDDIKKSIKRTLDPNNIMNPGKIFDLN